MAAAAAALERHAQVLVSDTATGAVLAAATPTISDQSAAAAV
jgi:hypothetical protein